MSTRFDDILKIGETWSFVVECTDEGDENLNPVTADWKLITLDSVDVLSLTQSSGIVIVGNICTITIPTIMQSGVDPGIYIHRLKVTDIGGAVSRQMHGAIRVLADE